MNDHPDLAVRAGFDGVHVGQEDVSPTEARQIVGHGGIVGVSTHNLAQLELAICSRLITSRFGPVFATTTKLNPDPVIGLEGVRDGRSVTAKPLVAIGGITLENAIQVLDAGADSVAIVSAIFGRGKREAEIAREFFRLWSNSAKV